LAERDGITRRYVRRLVDLAFLSPELVEVILQGRQPVHLTAARLTEVDLPLGWDRPARPPGELKREPRQRCLVPGLGSSR
jgi:site-specific DNA recombinase